MYIRISQNFSMDSEVLLKDSFAYAQEALVGKWIRWAIFIVLSLPFSLIQFVVDPKKISDGMKMQLSPQQLFHFFLIKPKDEIVPDLDDR
jgi:hypothetical protein